MRFKILLCLIGALLLGCVEKQQSDVAPATKPSEEIRYDLRSFAALEAEVLVREHATSLVKYVKFQDQYLAGFNENITLELSVFIFDNGTAKILAEWVYPEFLENGGRVMRTHDAFFETTWTLQETGLLVGDDWLEIQLLEEGQTFSGWLMPRYLEPPPFPLERLVPEKRVSTAEMPVRFEVVSEVVEASWVVEIFGR